MLSSEWEPGVRQMTVPWRPYLSSKEGRCYPLLAVLPCWNWGSILPHLLISKVLMCMGK